jgi:hypothetical protein
LQYGQTSWRPEPQRELGAGATESLVGPAGTLASTPVGGITFQIALNDSQAMDTDERANPPVPGIISLDERLS